MKFVQSFYLYRRLMNTKFSLISLTCLPQLHNIKNLCLAFLTCGDLHEGYENTIQAGSSNQF